jgi:hypothetical protein
MCIIESLLIAFKISEYSLGHIKSLELWLERDDSITIDIIKESIKTAIEDPNFDWVNLAINTKFVYTPYEVNPESFDVDDLLIFTDSFRWKDVVQPDAILTPYQRSELKEQFREIGVQYFDNIYELIDHSDFNWLPFEVKHAYKSSFGEMTYTNEDIIYYLKTLIWEYLYPDSYDSYRLDSIKKDGLLFIQSQDINEGWTEMSQVVEFLKVKFPGIDLYELSKIDWGQDIQHKNHYRNPFTLGFKRMAPDSLIIEQQYS